MRYWVTAYATRYYELQTPIEADSEEEAWERADGWPYEWYAHCTESEHGPEIEVDTVELMDEEEAKEWGLERLVYGES